MDKSRIEKVVIQSKCLNKEMNSLVYLPCGYDEGESFPTLYFLHGRSGDENILTGIDMHIATDRLIEAKEIAPMIIVCPNIDNSRGVNSSPDYREVKDPFGRIINIGLYEDYLIKEVVPEIDKQFKTIQNRNGRYIGGVSAGGYTALHQAFRHPDMFSTVGGHMPAIELQLEEEDKAYFQNCGDWEKYDPIKIAREMECTDFNVYLDAGNQDEGGFYQGCSILNKILKEKGIESQNHIFEGHHSVEYIKSNIEKYLRFYGSHMCI
ncbi:alpha/beta hydrolase [Prevotella sp.]|uniref:alpha/beta hydrolase n=1 Tax=Prevotella sp. TaxID=59823 RepID=UPI003DA3692B